MDDHAELLPEVVLATEPAAADPAAEPAVPAGQTPVAAPEELPWAVPVLPRPGFWMAVGWCFLLFLAEMGVAFVLGIGLGLAGQGRDQGLFAALGSLIAGIGAVVFALVAVRRQPCRALGLRRPRWLHVMLALLLVPPGLVLTEEISERVADGLDAVTARTVGGGFLAGSTSAPDTAAYLRWVDKWDILLAGQPWWIVLLAGCLAPGIGEEFFFRGLLGRGLVARYGVVCGVLLTSCLFGLAHVDPVKVSYAAFLGIVLHSVYLNSKSLWPPILLHVTHNVLALTRTKLVLAGELDLTETSGWLPVSPTLAVASLAAIGGLAVWFYRTRICWRRADGRVWSAGYAGAESPAATAPVQSICSRGGRWTAVLGFGAYAGFAGHWRRRWRAGPGRWRPPRLPARARPARPGATSAKQWPASPRQFAGTRRPAPMPAEATPIA